jgi:hypothetical protein
MTPGDAMTLTEIRENVFRGRIAAARLRDACQLLTELGGFEVVQQMTEGRPRTLLRRLTEAEGKSTRRASNNGVSEKQEKHEGGGFSGFSPFSDRVAP